MTEEAKKRMEELKSVYRYEVWPDAYKDKARTRDADLACLGFEAGFDACDEEIVQKLQEENKKLREALEYADKLIKGSITSYIQSDRWQQYIKALSSGGE